MSPRIQKQKLLPLVVPTLIGIAFITLSGIGFFTSENMFITLLSGFFIILGTFILFFSLREFNYRRKGVLIIKHDERSEINRLKATDWGFRFLLISLMVLIVLNTIRLINEIAFVALIGPIIAVSIGL
ncbi:MAG: hypothetical protein ACFFBD_29925, partial [Candidatus Hodarchaeota archaeon]